MQSRPIGKSFVAVLVVDGVVYVEWMGQQHSAEAWEDGCETAVPFPERYHDMVATMIEEARDTLS